jgi:hypothetical protein
MQELHFTTPEIDTGDFFNACGVTKASPVFCVFSNGEDEREYWCSLMEPQATLPDASQQISAFVLEAPVNTLCRARIRSQRMGAAGAAPCLCYVNGIRTGNETGQVHIHSISAGGSHVLRGGVDASVYAPAKDAVKGWWGASPVDVGLVSPDRIPDIEFQVIGNEPRHLLLALAYTAHLKQQTGRPKPC